MKNKDPKGLTDLQIALKYLCDAVDLMEQDWISLQAKELRQRGQKAEAEMMLHAFRAALLEIASYPGNEACSRIAQTVLDEF